MNFWPWIFGAIGAGLGAFGDYIILAAYKDKTHAALKLTLGVIAWMLCAPAWYFLVRETGGKYAAGAVAWTASGALMGVALALFLREKLTPWQWVGFLITGLGAVIHAIATPKD